MKSCGADDPSEPFRKAIDYALNQRNALLCLYLEDGRLRPDNNLVENAIRSVVISRKNGFFVGRERGDRAALFMSLVRYCKDFEINPCEYLADMLRRIMSHPENRLRELLPDQWKLLPKGE